MADRGSNRLQHSGPGENLYWFAGAGGGDDRALAAVDYWYDEINNYDFGTGTSTNGKKTGHFTQVITELKYEI